MRGPAVPSPSPRMVARTWLRPVRRPPAGPRTFERAGFCLARSPSRDARNPVAGALSTPATRRVHSRSGSGAAASCGALRVIDPSAVRSSRAAAGARPTGWTRPRSVNCWPPGRARRCTWTGAGKRAASAVERPQGPGGCPRTAAAAGPGVGGVPVGQDAPLLTSRPGHLGAQRRVPHQGRPVVVGAGRGLDPSAPKVDVRACRTYPCCLAAAPLASDDLGVESRADDGRHL
jgi:hypothetical protein